MKTVISGAEFFDFEVTPVFSGQFKQPVIREQDSQANPDFKKGDVMGYLFTDVDGNDVIIGASHQITKALTDQAQGVGGFYKISFLGKGTTAKNQPFNNYRVEQYDDQAEFESLNKPKG
jgi:hypothetical protein